MKILLVEPAFPIPPKSKNHKNFLPIGLLKLHDYYKSKGLKTKLVRGNKSKSEIGTRFKPDQIMITSLFTYWSQYVWDSVKFYRDNYPTALVTIGGIYASLMGDQPDFKRKLRKYNAGVFFGIHKGAEKYANNHTLDYSILSNPSPIDYQIIHTTRGCPRNCEFCGTWKIEPNFESKKSIRDEIIKRKIVFYDNNLLKSQYIEDILNELITLKQERKILWCESQSGFDGRVLEEKSYLGKMLKKAGFRYPRIAWDWGYDQFREIKEQIDILVSGGYNFKDIYIFMLYNWDIPFEEMERKRIKCWEWNVQIADCRYRPLDQISDKYNPRKEQTNKDYHIHTEAGWTDALVKQFRKNVRRQNICVRHRFPFYSKEFERKRVKDEIMRATKHKKTKEEKIKYLEEKGINFWLPDEITYPNGQNAK